MDLSLPVSLVNWLLFAGLVIVFALTALSFQPLVNYIKAHIQGGVFDTLRKWAYTYVAALEQDPTLKGLASEEKKQQAVVWLVEKAAELNIPLSTAEASNLVEEAVYLVKKVVLSNLSDALEP